MFTVNESVVCQTPETGRGEEAAADHWSGRSQVQSPVVVVTVGRGKASRLCFSASSDPLAVLFKTQILIQ